MTRAHAIAASLVLALTLTNCFAHVLKGSRQPEGKAGETSINWGEKNLAEQLARNVKAGPKIALQKSGQNSNSATLALLKQQRQSAAAAASSNKPGVSGVEASPSVEDGNSNVFGREPRAEQNRRGHGKVRHSSGTGWN